MVIAKYEDCICLFLCIAHAFEDEVYLSNQHGLERELWLLFRILFGAIIVYPILIRGFQIPHNF